MRRTCQIATLIIITILICGSSHARQRWQWVNPLPQGNDLNDVFFVDRDEGWTVGDAGTILHTMDGGQSWEFQDCGTTDDLLSVCFVDEDRGWVLAVRRFRFVSLLTTTDGGEVWENIFSNDNMWDARKLVFKNRDEGWLIHCDRIKHTSDGGRVWTEQENVHGANLRDLTFVDHLHGWVVGNQFTEDYSGQIILSTIDGGANWELIRVDKTINSLYGLSFVNANTGWIVGDDGVILHTADGGMTWEFQESNTFKTLRRVCFTDSLHGWTIGSCGEIFHTDDGGGTWNRQYADYGDFDYTCGMDGICFVDERTGWFVGYAGAIYHTDDGGIDWIEQSQGSRKDYYSIQFADDDNGWIIEQDRFLYTANGGRSWKASDDIDEIGESNSCVFFLDALHGWRQFRTEIWRTDNGGIDWYLTGSLPDSYGRRYTQNAQAIFFSDIDNGWIVGSHSKEPNPERIYTGMILHTINGGRDWEVRLKKEDTAPLHEIFFIDEKHGWAAGAFKAICDPISCPPIGSVARTVNGGQTWTTQNFDDFFYIGDMFFADTLHGWIAGEGVLHTSDGGVTWAKQDTLDYTGPAFSAIHFLNPGEGWAVGSHWRHGAIYHTTNGGQNWNLHQANIPEIYDMGFTEDQGWIVGDKGLIMTYRLEPQLRGDLNRDGSIDVLDVERSIQILLKLGIQATSYEFWAADCNGDDIINVLDIIGIVNVVLGKGICEP